MTRFPTFNPVRDPIYMVGLPVEEQIEEELKWFLAQICWQLNDFAHDLGLDRSKVWAMRVDHQGIKGTLWMREA